MDPQPLLDLDDGEPASHSHGYSVGMQCLFVRLVLAGASLRGAAATLAILAEAFGWLTPTPHWTTGRLWLLRLGHFVLTTSKQPGTDWAWLIDHSVQIGPQKCLAIIGVRLADLPKLGQALTHIDMELIALVPGVSWTQEDVDKQLEIGTAMTGVPRVIVNDHGGDVAGGVRLFQERHPETVDIYDAKHKAACVLKGRLDKNPRWQEFQQQVGQTRCAIQQTELAYLAPPSPKLKSRFMNLGAMLRWANQIVAIVQQPPAIVQQTVSSERLQEKLGWMVAFAADVAEWGEWQAIIDIMVTFVSAHGVYREVAKDLRAALPRQPQHASSVSLRAELLVFVAKQARRLRPNERVPGSTEVLESLFGHMKQLEKQQARGGFTSLLLGFGARLADITTKVMKQAMEQSGTKQVYDWCKEHLGTTLFGKRKLAFAASATKTG
jgi:hypothetical protein